MKYSIKNIHSCIAMKILKDPNVKPVFSVFDVIIVTPYEQNDTLKKVKSFLSLSLRRAILIATKRKKHSAKICNGTKFKAYHFSKSALSESDLVFM